MAKLTITLQDRENGKVHIVSNPTMEKLIHIAKHNRHTMTDAEVYMLVALRRLVEFSGELMKDKLNLSGTPRTKLM